MNFFLDTVVEKSQVVSFDVFDTLLLRKCGLPRNVFHELERKTGRRGFAEARITAEQKANRRVAGKEFGEISIEEIYSHLPQYSDLMDAELSFEKDTVYANPEIVSIWERVGRLGKKRIICSDMYLSRRFIEELLRKNGIAGWDEIYVSSERKARKSTGKLFEMMVRELGVDPMMIFHIGDNALGDVRQANAKGIVAYRYCRGVESGVVRPFATHIKWSQDVEDGWREFGSEDYWDRLGYAYAGVLGYAYVRFVGDEALRRGITRLLLVYRDGYNLEPIFNELYPQLKTVLIYAPRQTSFFVTQDFGADVRMRRKFLWQHLCLAGEDSEEEGFLATGVLSSENKKKFDERTASARREYAEYFATLSIGSDERVALVDMTTGSLSSTKLVEKTLGREIVSFYLVCIKPYVKLTNHIIPMLHAHTGSAIFMWMSEFFFTGPTPTVRDIRSKKPVYGMNRIFDEFKISVCKKIRSSGAMIASARNLMNRDVRITRGEFIEYFERFHAALTAFDESEFSFAREANNMDQNNFSPIFHNEMRAIRPFVRILGRNVVNYRIYMGGASALRNYISEDSRFLYCRVNFDEDSLNARKMVA